jgi:hypothetical protein
MISAADSVDRVRPFAAALVQSEERRRGSRMSAYHAVAQVVGVSESWVRRLLGRRHVVVEHHHALNLASAYRRLCERIEAEAERERQITNALRREADEIVASTAGLVDSPSGSDCGAEAP